MTITIRVEGAQPEEIVRGLLAAQEVLDKATPDQAAIARFVVEGWDIRGFTGKVPESEFAICTVWDEADQAAVRPVVPAGPPTKCQNRPRSAFHCLVNNALRVWPSQRTTFACFQVTCV